MDRPSTSQAASERTVGQGPSLEHGLISSAAKKCSNRAFGPINGEQFIGAGSARVQAIPEETQRAKQNHSFG